MIDSKQGITPESLLSVTRFITSQREQRGYEQKTVQIIGKAIQAARKQVKVLEEMKKAKSP